MSDLDALVRQGLGRLVDSTPITPSFEHIARSGEPNPQPRLSWQRFRRAPNARVVLVAAVAMLVVGAGLGYAVAGGGSTNGYAGRASTTGSTVRLASYTAHLPAGYVVSTSTASNCQMYPGLALRLPMQNNATYAIATPTATACIGSLLTATYGLDSSTAPSPDPVAPSSGTRVNVGAYHATVGTGTGFTGICEDIQDQPPSCPLPPDGQTSAAGQRPLGMWVQIPSIGGGYHDLVVGSWGLSQAQLISIVQSALPDHVVAADAGRPPWSVLPCAPGQTPDPNAPSAGACATTP